MIEPVSKLSGGGFRRSFLKAWVSFVSMSKYTLYTDVWFLMFPDVTHSVFITKQQ